MIPRRQGRPLGVGVQLPEVEREVRWPELRAIARLAEDAGFDSIWVGDHLLYRYASGRGARAVGGLDDPRRARRGDRADHPGAARGGDGVPRAVHAREARLDGGRDLGRTAGPGHRRRLERDRVRRARRAVRPPDQPLRGGVHDRADAAQGRCDRLRGRVLPRPRRRAAAPAGASRRPAAADRLERPPHARGHAPVRGRVERLVRGHPQLARRCRAAANAHRRRRPGGRAATRPRSSGRSPSWSSCRAAPGA